MFVIVKHEKKKKMNFDQQNNIQQPNPVYYVTPQYNNNNAYVPTMNYGASPQYISLQPLQMVGNETTVVETQTNRPPIQKEYQRTKEWKYGLCDCCKKKKFHQIK